MIQTIETSDLDEVVTIVNDMTFAGVTQIRELSGGYFFVDVQVDDDELRDLEAELDYHNLDWTWQ